MTSNVDKRGIRDVINLDNLPANFSNRGFKKGTHYTISKKHRDNT